MHGLYGSIECHIADRFNAAHPYPLFGAGFFYVEVSLVSSDESGISGNAENLVAFIALGNRAVFFYPPGSVSGWTIKRLLVFSVAGFLFWSIVIMAVQIVLAGGL